MTCTGPKIEQVTCTSSEMNRLYNFLGVTRATMYFFNTNPSGRILNRFSKDTGNIDAVLPGALLDCIWFLFEMAAVMIVVAIVNYWLLIPTLILAVLMFLIRNVYVHTSRSVKRVESLCEYLRLSLLRIK